MSDRTGFRRRVAPSARFARHLARCMRANSHSLVFLRPSPSPCSLCSPFSPSLLFCLCLSPAMAAASSSLAAAVLPPPSASQPNSHRHYLLLALLHLARMLAQAIGLRNNAAALPHGCMPPACVAKAPRPISGQAVDTHGCARLPWPFHATPPPTTSSLRPQQQAPTTSPAVICDQGPRAQI